jgi:MFS family permease
MRTFLIIWIGQLASLIGSEMTNFAITIWAWEVTGQATPLSLILFFTQTPKVIAALFAGVLVDRWHRQKLMLVGDLMAGFSTIAILLLFLSDRLEIWHLYCTGAINGLFGFLQASAYSASLSLIVPKQHYARATALNSIQMSGSYILAPALAGSLYPSIGLVGILIIDLVTFIIAISSISVVQIPQLSQSQVSRQTMQTPGFKGNNGAQCGDPSFRRTQVPAACEGIVNSPPAPWEQGTGDSAGIEREFTPRLTQSPPGEGVSDSLVDRENELPTDSVSDPQANLLPVDRSLFPRPQVDDLTFGFRYLFKHPSLLAILVFLLVDNLIDNLNFAILPATILARSNNDPAVWGQLLTTFGIGGLLGAATIGIWGGPNRRIHGLLVGSTISKVGLIVLSVTQNMFVKIAAALTSGLSSPFPDSSNQAIWMSKVKPDIQGRVFAARDLITQITAPLGAAIAGPLADNFFEPAMRNGGSLTGIFSGFFGTEIGAGMALMITLFSSFGLLFGLAGYALPILREVEDIVPDHERETR